jgi:putative SOS response-associated peptidase YedK
MCGRFVRKTSLAELADKFDAQLEADLEPNYNIAPTDEVAVVLFHARLQKKALVPVRWGLVPAWSKDTSVAAKLINARSETLAEKPSFRAAFKARRCLILADGFYEWKSGAENQKQPVYIHLKSQMPLAFAGLYEHWKKPEGGWLSTCAVITTQANQTLSPIHQRMPVILGPEQQALWLDPDLHDSAVLSALLKPLPDDEIDFYPVSPEINKVRFNNPACLDAV